MSVNYWGVGSVVDHIACLKLEESDNYYGSGEKELLDDLRNVIIKWLGKMPYDHHYYVSLDCVNNESEIHGPYIGIGLKVSHQRGPKDNLSPEKQREYKAGEIGIRE